MTKDKLTPKALQILALAKKEAQGLKNNCAGTEHLLLGLLDSPTKTIYAVLIKYGVQIKDLKTAVYDCIGVGESKVTNFENITFTPRVSRVINKAILRAEQLSISKAEVEHIFYSLLDEDDGMASSVLKTLGVEAKQLVKEFQDFIPEKEEGKEKEQTPVPSPVAVNVKPVTAVHKRKRVDLKFLNSFAIDLTHLASERKLPPLIGREEEVEKIIQVLCRKSKNNPILIGEAGVGKTAVIEGLAQRIVDDPKIPEKLKKKSVFSLDIAALIAGTKFRGQFEERVKGVLNDAKANGDIILFIDEAHQVIGAGSGDKVCDLGNLLKPSLARSELTCAAATTLTEYRATIEKDGALKRRFQMVKINPPSIAESTLILEGIKKIYEDHHKVVYEPDTMSAIVKLTDRFMPNLQLPDKAISVLDAVGTCKRIACDKDPLLSNHVFITDVRACISEATEIPDYKLEYGAKLVGDLEQHLSTNIIGQSKAITTVVNTLKRAHAELRDPKRPIGSFLFLGPTGNGKSHFGRMLAEHLFGCKRDHFIKIDMTEFSEGHTASSLIGAPPGYVGYDKGGKLTEFVKRQPYSIVLFDEIEKAHQNALQILLQILEDGVLTDRSGDVIDFKNTIILMTSNAGAAALQAKGGQLGFTTSTTETVDQKVLEEVRKLFTAEFVNRIDEIVIFNKLTREDIKRVLSLYLREYDQRLMDNHKLTLVTEDSVLDYLVDKGYSELYGARQLRRVIQTEFEVPLADCLLKLNTRSGSLTATLVDGKIDFMSKVLKLPE